MEVSTIRETRLRDLREYFERRDDIAFAFLFGSGAKGRVRKEGDIDIAVYFRPEKDVEWEAFNKTFAEERRIGRDMEQLMSKVGRLQV